MSFEAQQAAQIRKEGLQRKYKSWRRWLRWAIIALVIGIMFLIIGLHLVARQYSVPSSDFWIPQQAELPLSIAASLITFGMLTVTAFLYDTR